jgi:hypothetical protein
LSSRGDPTGDRQHEEKLFVGAPRQRPGHRFGRRTGVSCDGTGNCDIERRRPYRDGGSPARAASV